MNDLEAAKTALLEAGHPVQSSASGRAALFTQDADGNIIELSQEIYSYQLVEDRFQAPGG